MLDRFLIFIDCPRFGIHNNRFLTYGHHIDQVDTILLSEHLNGVAGDQYNQLVYHSEYVLYQYKVNQVSGRSGAELIAVIGQFNQADIPQLQGVIQRYQEQLEGLLQDPSFIDQANEGLLTIYLPESDLHREISTLCMPESRSIALSLIDRFTRQASIDLPAPKEEASGANFKLYLGVIAFVIVAGFLYVMMMSPQPSKEEQRLRKECREHQEIKEIMPEHVIPEVCKTLG